MSPTRKRRTQNTLRPSSVALLSLLTLLAGAAGCAKPDDVEVARSAVLADVQVTVVDTGGTPQAGWTVFSKATSGARDGFVATNSLGQAVLSVNGGSYTFGVTRTDATFWSGADGHCVVPSCTSATITVQKPVTVTVVDEHGSPQPAARVVAEDTNDNQVAFVDADAQGHADVWVNTGSYSFYVIVDGTLFRSGAEGHCVVPGCTTASITIPAPVLVTVDDGAGHPLANKEIVSEDAAGNTGDVLATDSSGHAIFRLAEGAYRFVVPGDGVFWTSGAPGHCTVPGCTSATVHVYEVLVTVVDGAGSPLAGKEVASEDSDGNQVSVEYTDADGHATIPVLAGGWRFVTPGAKSSFSSGAPGHCVVPGCTAATIIVDEGCDGMPDGTACNDHNACTRTDVCQNGVCVGSNAVTCAASDQCHVAGTCDTSTGVCSNPARTDGSACDDGSACTQTDTCQSGACVGSPLNVDDGNPCTADSCDPASGPRHAPLAAGTGCGDGQPCSGPDVCDGHGACLPVDDTNACTADVCDPGLGLRHIPLAAGTPCANSAACPGKATCDGSGTCSACIVGQLRLLYRDSQVANGGSVAVPSVLAGSKGVVVPLTITNAGDGDLILSGTPNITIAGPNAADFSIRRFPPSTLAAGKSGSIELRFAPSAAGLRNASLQIASNDPSNNPFVISLSATGLSPGDLGSDTNGNRAAGAAALCNTREARLMARTGDIDNLGFGWPTGFDPFAGLNTPVHGYPWTVNPNDPAGTDRIFVGTSFTNQFRDGYSRNSTRPANLPQCIAVDLHADCFDGTLPSSAILQMFVDDFQPRVWGSLFQVTINGTRATQIENGINLLAQTGPIGKLMSFTLTPDQLPLLQSGTATICIDDPTTGMGDGYAIDFVKLLVDVYGTDFKGTINGRVTASVGGAPIVGATVSAGGVVSTTSDANGNYVLSNVPAGFVYLYANAPGYETTGQVIDLPNAQTATVNISMRPDRPPVISSTPVTQVQVGATYSYKVVAVDPDGDSLTFGVPQAPPGMTFNESTGQITWAPTADQVGSWPISVEVNDRRGGVAVQAFQIQVTSANQPPVVSCQPDVHLVGSSATLTLSCAVSDDGLVNGTPTTGWFFDFRGTEAPTLSATGTDHTDVTLSAPGIYEFVLRASDGQYQVSDSVIVTLSPSTAPPLVFAGADQATTSMTATLAGTVVGGSGSASVQWSQVEGPAPVVIATPGQLTTQVAFSRTGSYRFRLTATDGVSSDSDDVAVVVQPAIGANPTQGWIGAPTHQSAVTGQVPIKLSSGITLTSGTVSYWPAAAPDQVHVLVTGASGGPGATLASLDTTLLANGPYVVRLTATNAGGAQQTSVVAVTVSGDYKPGRMTLSITDFTVPLVGLPITIGRAYDSLERNKVGDFGNGWSLSVGNPRLETDPAHNVTVTEPNGRRATYTFTPTAFTGPFNFLFAPAYTPAPGVFGSLTSDGCSLMVISAGQLACFLELGGTDYVPTTYTYKDPYGREYTIAATGQLAGIKDLNGNRITIDAKGITSSAGGVHVSFVRDGSGRITQITDLDGNPWTYQYDPTGDLIGCTTPGGHHSYAYDGGHLLVRATDPNGHFPTRATYDPQGRLITMTDGSGNVTQYGYNLATHTNTITNPDGGVVAQVFDDRGLLLSETNPLGRATTRTYDSQLLKTHETNALNETTDFGYDSFGRQTSQTEGPTNARRTTRTTYNDFGQRTGVTDAAGNTTTIAYDDQHNPTLFSDSLGTISRITSSAQGLPLTVTDGEGGTKTNAYDTHGNRTSSTDRLGRVTTFEYDDMGRLTLTTDQRGAETRLTYTGLGKVATRRDALGSTTSYTYDGVGNVLTESRPGTTALRRYTYDAADRATSIEDFDGSTRSFTYDFRGNELTETDQLGRTTQLQYDLDGHLVQTTFPDQTVTSTTYDQLGRVAFKTDERGKTTTYGYEPGCGCTERLTLSRDALGRTTQMTYDALGRRTSTTDAANHRTTYAYDARDRLTTTTYPDGTTTVESYDGVGRRVARTDQTGAVTRFGYDAEDELTSVTDPLGARTVYEYDAAGNLAVANDANEHRTSYGYDLLRRKVSRTLPLQQSESFAYDAVGNLVSHVDFRGKTTAFGYDLRNQLLSRTPDPTLGEPTESYTYTATGRRASMTDASGSTTYAYDSRDRMLTKATPAGTLTYSYDPAGNVTTVRSSNANGTSVDYAWDAGNQLASVTDNRLGGVTTAAYTATGQPLALANPNGASAAYAYDNLDRVTSLAWNQNTAPPFASWAYTYNGRGQRLSATELSGRQAAYGYDAATHLTSETITGDPRGAAANGALNYVVDLVGNRLSRTAAAGLTAQTFSYDANDQISADTFDPNGNTTASGGNTFTYDFRDRLKSKNDGGVTIVYDCDGNRAAKTVGVVTTKFLVDDLNPTGYVQVLEEVVGGAVQVRYAYGTSVVSQTRNVGGTAQTSYYGYDAHGNITFLSNAAGTVTDTYEYDAWGTIVAATGTTPNRRSYAGEEVDPDLGLIALRARYYRSNSGRFLTIDSAAPELSDPITMNRYLYGNGDAVDLTDPSGRAPLNMSGMEILARALGGVATLAAATFAKYYTSGHSGPALQVAAGWGIYSSLIGTAVSLKVYPPVPFIFGAGMACTFEAVALWDYYTGKSEIADHEKAHFCI